MSYIKKKMDDNGLFKNYTMQSLLDELDIIEYYISLTDSTHKIMTRRSSVHTKQYLLYQVMLNKRIPNDRICVKKAQTARTVAFQVSKNNSPKRSSSPNG